MSPDGDGRRSSAGGRMLLALLVGLVVGAVVTVLVLASGLLPFGDGDEVAAGSPTPTSTPGETPAAAASGDVPAPCLTAAEHNATVSAALDDVAIGVRDQDARAVEDGLDAIADVKREMDAASAECREIAGAEGDADADGGTDTDSADDSADDGADDDADADSDTDPGRTSEPSPTRTP